MNRGYSGFYKNEFLRSSYEYAFAKYLDHFNIKWKYEEKCYDLNRKKYTPDFFIYTGDILVKIVEVKNRNKKVIEKAEKLLEELSNMEKVETEIISYEQLLDLYREMPYSLNSTLTEWIDSPDTTISKRMTGENNPHFNHSHTKETKKVIGEHTKKLWLTNPEARKRMIEGLRKSGAVQKGKIKTPREVRICKKCEREFITLINSPQIYCNQKCAAKINVQLAMEMYVSNRNETSINIKKLINEWTLENKEMVLNTPYNKITTNLYPLFREIQVRFNVKDMRVISKAIFGKDKGRKELLKYMKALLTQ